MEQLPPTTFADARTHITKPTKLSSVWPETVTLKELKATLLLLGWSSNDFGPNTESWTSGNHIFQLTANTEMVGPSIVLFLNWYHMTGIDKERGRIEFDTLGEALIQITEIS